MAIVKLTNVAKTYDNGVKAVVDFDLQIADGEFVVLVGPSGSGKSTVLRMIAGLEEITAGQIAIGQRVVNRLHPKDRNIAMVFQDYALYPHMTVRENLSFALRLRKIPRTEVTRRADQVAAMLGISELLQRKPGVLSGGQQQRVALGRAIMRQPDAFLFDEPLSNLDAKLRVGMRSEIRGLQRRLKITSIYVTHDQEEAMTMADRVVVMCDGRVQQVAAPLEVYGRPVNRFVASFVGAPPMNFIDGHVEQRHGQTVFVETAPTSNQDAWQLHLPEIIAQKLDGNQTQRAVVLGVRPQAFSAVDGSPADDSAPSIRISVNTFEPLGDVIDVHGATPGGTPVVARLAARGVTDNAVSMMLRIDPDRVHLFEPGEFGRNLALH